MEKNLFIDASHPEETRVVLKSDNGVEEYEYENKNRLNFKNNIYLGTVSRVEPSLQAAFINFGRVKHGFLAFNDIQSDYYQIPTEDKDRLKEAEEKIREDLKKTSLEEVDQNSNDNHESVNENNIEENINETTQLDNNNFEEEKLNAEVPLVETVQPNQNVREKLKNTYGVKRYKIQEVIKPGQVILIQVTKEERGNKGAALTTFISLAGKFMVLMPNTAKGGGISRKIFNSSDRTKIRSILNEIEIPKSMGVIVRTAAEGVSEESLKNDIDKLISEWEKTSSKDSGSSPVLIHEEPDISIKVIREHLSSNFKKLLIENNEKFEDIKSYISDTSPELNEIVEKYSDDLDLFERYHIEDQIKKALDRKVWLPSGGHLIIDRTEALTVIDVNTGKFVGKDSLEQTVFENNLEAAEEIARQLRLRDIGGIIVIDFIDMETQKRQQELLSKFKQELAKDKTRTQVFDISRLGLVEMTRKNVSAGLIESFSDECEECNGRGLIIGDIFSNNSVDTDLLESEAVVE